MVPSLNSRDSHPKRHQSEPPGMSRKVGKKSSYAVTIVQEKDLSPKVSTCRPIWNILILVSVVGMILAVDGLTGYGHLAKDAATEACFKIDNATFDRGGDHGRSEESEKAVKMLAERMLLISICTEYVAEGGATEDCFKFGNVTAPIQYYQGRPQELEKAFKESTQNLLLGLLRYYASRADTQMCGIICRLVKTIGKPAEPDIKEKVTPEVDAEAEGEAATGRFSAASYDAAAECREARVHAIRIWNKQVLLAGYLWFLAYGCAYGIGMVLVFVALALVFYIIYVILKAIYRFIINQLSQFR